MKIRNTGVAFVFLIAAVSPLLQGQTTVTVSGAATIALTDQATGTRLQGCTAQPWMETSVPLNSPAKVPLSLSGVKALQFTATGTVHNPTSHSDDGPDGASDPALSVVSAGRYGIGKIDAPLASLVGLFVGDSLDGSTAPSMVQYWGGARDMKVLRPMLQQPFLIGTGKTAAGIARTLVVPAGATRLFLGVSDPCPGTISGGSFRVTATAVAEPAAPGLTVDVPGVAAMGLAGAPPGTQLQACAASAPLNSPVAPALSLTGGSTVRIRATGEAAPYRGDVYWFGPSIRAGGTVSADGGNAVAVAATTGGIGRIFAPAGSLIGMFAGDTITPTAPAEADYSTPTSRNQTTLTPALQQPFFIGRGVTEAGEVKAFRAPAGASRLYLAVAEGCPEGTRGGYQATVTVAGPDDPQFTVSGMVNAAGYGPTGLVPGSLAALFGSGFAPALAEAGSTPLPTELKGTRVLFDDVAAPLLFVSPGQINLQVPWSVAGAKSSKVVVANGPNTSLAVEIPIISEKPGLFTFGDGAPVVTNALTGAVVNAGNPAKAGDILTFYGSGLGAVTSSVASGSAAPLDRLVYASANVTMMFGAASANTLFAGLAPGFIGVYQINVTVPGGIGAGTVSVTLSANGATSNTVQLATR